MKKKLIAILLLTATMILSFSACNPSRSDLVNKTYIYENFGAGGAFTITINEDGTFKYNEGSETTYVANGTWTYKKGILTLDDQMGEEFNLINQFKVEDGALVFIAEGSSNFISVKVADGERFFDTSK